MSKSAKAAKAATVVTRNASLTATEQAAIIGELVNTHGLDIRNQWQFARLVAEQRKLVKGSFVDFAKVMNDRIAEANAVNKTGVLARKYSPAAYQQFAQAHTVFAHYLESYKGALPGPLAAIQAKGKGTPKSAKEAHAILDSVVTKNAERNQKRSMPKGKGKGTAKDANLSAAMKRLHTWAKAHKFTVDEAINALIDADEATHNAPRIRK